MFKKLIRNDFFKNFVLFIVFILIVLLIQHFYVIINTSTPLEVSKSFIYILLERPELDKLDNVITKDLHKKIKNNNELEKYIEEPTKSILRHNDIKPMSITYIDDVTAICGVGFHRDNSVKDSYIMVLKLEKHPSESWFEKLKFWSYAGNSRTWLVSDYIAKDNISDIKYTDKDLELMTKKANKEITDKMIDDYIEANNEVSQFVMKKEYKRLKEIYNKTKVNSLY